MAQDSETQSTASKCVIFWGPILEKSGNIIGPFDSEEEAGRYLLSEFGYHHNGLYFFEKYNVHPDWPPTCALIKKLLRPENLLPKNSLQQESEVQNE